MESIFNLMRDYLNKRGIVAEEMSRGRLRFSINNLNYIFEVFEPDQFFFRMSLPNINQKQISDYDYSEIIQGLNRSFKVAKIVEQDNHDLGIIADQFVFSTNQIDLLFERLIQAMGDMIREFRQREMQQNNGTVGQ